MAAPPGDPTIVHRNHGVTAFFLALASKRWACVELSLELQDTEQFDLRLTQQHHDTGNTFVYLPASLVSACLRPWFTSRVYPCCTVTVNVSCLFVGEWVCGSVGEWPLKTLCCVARAMM